MKPIETVTEMIEYLRICEAAAITEPTKGYYRRLRGWLEESEDYRDLQIQGK